MDKIIIQIVNVKHQENLSSGFRVAQCEETDGCGEANGSFNKLFY